MMNGKERENFMNDHELDENMIDGVVGGASSVFGDAQKMAEQYGSLIMGAGQSQNDGGATGEGKEGNIDPSGAAKSTLQNGFQVTSGIIPGLFSKRG